MTEAAWFQLNQDKYPGVSVKATDLQGRVTVIGVQIERPGGVSVEDLRSVSIPAIEASLNDASMLGGLVRQRLRSGSPAPMPPSAPTKRQLRLSIPAGGRYPDEFYARVAMLYRALVANGVRPAPALADANEVPTSTVHRWIKEARARGALAPARKGGATG